MPARVRLLVLAVISAMVPSLGHAQQSAQSRSVPLAGPRIEATATAFRVAALGADSADVNTQRRSQNAGKPVALMVVGGAAILIGAVIGDDAGVIFMIGGAVALLYGLYQYMQ